VVALGALVFVSLLVISMLPSMVEAGQDVLVRSESVTDLHLSFLFPRPRIEGTGTDKRVAVDGLANTGDEGEPMLPYRTAKVLLPLGTEFSSVNLETGSPVWIGEATDLETGRTYSPTSDPEADPNRGSSARISSPVPFASFPGDQVEYTGTYVLDGMKVAIFRLYPVKYDVVGGLCYYPSLNLTIHLKGSESSVSRTFVDSGTAYWKVDNPEVIESYHAGRTSLGSDCPARYVIITSDALVQEFSDLAEWKESRGAQQPLLTNISAEAVTVEWIKSNPSYWGEPASHGRKGNDTQTQVRNFILDAHASWGTEFVLLGGDDEIIPARTIWVTGQYTENIPADVYYAGLDGTWDTDNDGIYGEGAGQGGGAAGDEADLLCEVSVGRATVDTVTEARNFVNKVVSYERDYSSNYLNKSLMVGNKLDDRPTWGGDYKDEMVADTFPTSNPDMEIQRLYERDGTFSKNALLSALNDGVNVVNHMGHGSKSEFADLTISDINSFTNTKYFVLYSQACNIGAFDQATSGPQESIAEHFVSSEHAAVAIIANSRYGWYAPGGTNGPSQYYDIQFFDAIFNEHIRSLGSALADSKEDLISSIGSTGSMRWCYMGINLLGDPETSVHFIEDRGHDVGVNDAEFGSPYVGKQCVVTSLVRNLGSAYESDVPVELLADGVLVSTSYVDIPAGGVAEAQFDWMPTSIRPTVLTVRSNLASDSWQSNDEVSVEADVSWEVSGLEIVEDETLSLGGNIVVTPTGQLEIFNTTLTFESSWDHHFGIDVRGSVDVRNSSVLCDGEVGFSFASHPGSSISARNASFERCVGGDDTPGFRISSDFAQILNVSFRECDGMMLSRSSGTVIRDVAFADCFNGLKIENSTGAEIARLEVVGADVGLDIEDCSDVQVLECQMHECRFGLEIGRSESLTLLDNIITDNRFDFGIIGSEKSHFLHDALSNSVTAGDLVYLIDQADLVINRSYGDVGCLIMISCANVSVSGLDLHNNFDGVFIYDSSMISITGCALHDNLVGIRAIGCDGNSVYRNDFVSNEINAWDDGIDSYNFSYPTGGNFWDDYTGIDEYSGPSQNMLGGDGIGDVPYSVKGGGCVDRYPFLRTVTDENHPPMADFTYSPSDPSSLDQIAFRDSSSDSDGRIVNWTWDFGDGRFAYSRNATHSYSDSGDYTVVLIVRDDESVEGSTSRTITVHDRAPTASFGFSPGFPAVGETVQFSDDSVDMDGVITSREWDFGDGSESSEASPTHVFTSKEVYLVVLTVTDDDGVSSTLTKNVAVGDEMPQAEFIYTPQEPTTLDEVQFIDSSEDPDGSITGWSWDFGDGSFSSKTNPSHRYSEDGFYVVRLVVRDDVGASDSAEIGVVILNVAPAVMFDWSPSNPSTLSDVLFSDGSTDPDGSIIDVRWDFGDGTSSEVRSPTHQYADDGAYTVTLTAKDNDGASNTTSRVVQVGNSLAFVFFEMSMLSPTSLENVSFVDRSSDPDGTIVSRNWSFGDSSWSEDASPVHRYARPSDYVIVLSVEDDDGGVNSTQMTVRVRNLPPVSDFDWDPESENAASTIRFQNMASDLDGSIASYRWIFGDGETSNNPSPDHVFSGEGSYDVTLTVTDDWGGTSSATKMIVVSLPDLQIRRSDIIVSPNGAKSGQNLTISVVVENNGSRSIHGAMVVFLVDGEVIGSRLVDIPSHSTATISTFWTAMEGDHELVLEVDSSEAISETSELNNRVTIPMSISGAQSSPLLSDLDIGIVILLVGMMVVVVGIVLLLRIKEKSGKR